MTNPFKQPGAFSWCELLTSDADAAKAFYGRLFGWTLMDGDVGGMTYTSIKAGDSEVGGMMTMPPDMQGRPPFWGVYVTVADIDATVQLAQELGATVLVPPMEIPDIGRFSMIRDPQGATFNVIAYSNFP